MTTITTQDGTTIKDGKVILPMPDRVKQRKIQKAYNAMLAAITIIVATVITIIALPTAINEICNYLDDLDYDRKTAAMLRKDLE